MCLFGSIKGLQILHKRSVSQSSLNLWMSSGLKPVLFFQIKLDQAWLHGASLCSGVKPYWNRKGLSPNYSNHFGGWSEALRAWSLLQSSVGSNWYWNSSRFQGRGRLLTFWGSRFFSAIFTIPKLWILGSVLSFSPLLAVICSSPCRSQSMCGPRQPDRHL